MADTNAEARTGGRKFQRILGYGLAALLALAGLFAGWLYLNTDTIKNAIIGKLNQHLDAPVAVKQIELGWWEHFPHISLTFRQVVIMGSGRHGRDTLARAESIYFTLNAWHAFQGKYELKTAGMEEARIRMVNYPDGSHNWDILKKDTSRKSASGKPGQDPAFAIKVFKGKAIRYIYQDSGRSGTYFAMRTDKLKAAFAYQHKTTAVDLALEGYLKDLSSNGSAILQELPVALSTGLTISKEKGIQVAPSKIDLGKAGFEAQGNISITQTGNYDFTIEGRQTTLAHLGVLMPASARKALDSYQSSGQVRFSTRIYKNKARLRYPSIQAKFTCRNAAFRHDSLNLRFSSLNLDGGFTLVEGNTLAGSTLNLSHIGGSLNGQPLSGRLLLQNLNDPTISGRLKAVAPLAMFEASLRQAGLVAPQGTIAADINILPSNFGKNQKIAATGTLDLRDLGFDAGAKRLAFRGWQGRLDISQGAVSAEGLSGRIGRSDFRVDGHFENLLGYLRGIKPQLGVEASITCGLIDLDELLGGNSAPTAIPVSTSSTKKANVIEEEYRFTIAQHLRLNASIHAGLVRFRRAHVRNFQGNITVADKVLGLEGITFHLGGGRAAIDGTLDARTAGSIANRYRFQLSGIRIDSALYALENFDQGYLRSDNIRGRVDARGTLSFQMSDRLDVDSRTAEAETDIEITQGALTNFEPLQAMAKYIESKELENLQFSDLKNHLTVRSRTVTIPEMEIRSNAANLVVAGYHSFDQEMQYRIRVPLKNVRMKSGLFKTAEGSAFEGNLFLLLSGTPGNIKVSIDKKATGEKIGQDLKEGKKRFLDIFKKKDKEPWETKDGKRVDELDPKKEEKKDEKPKEEFFDF